MTAAVQIASPPATRVRYGVLAALCAATIIAYVDRGCIAVAKDAIARDLALSDEAMGDIMSVFFLSYALCQLPAGWLGGAWGPRRALPAFATAWSICTGLAALAMGYPMLLLTRLGMGAAEAGVFPCAMSTLAQWFPASRRALVSGVLGAFMGIGAAIGAALTGVLLGHVDWRWLFVLYAIPGVVWSVWFLAWFRDRPEEHPAVNAGERALIRADVVATDRAAPAGPTPWLQIFTSAPMFWLSGQQFFRGAGYVFYISWFPTYLMETRGVTLAAVGWLSSLPHVAQVAGSILGGGLADWILARTGSRRASRQGVSGVSLLACAGLIALSYFVADATLAVLVITLGALCASLAGGSAYAVSMDTGGRHVAAVFSVMNMAGNVGAILFPLAVPRLVKATGSWDLALFLFAGVHLAAAVCWCFVRASGSIVREPSPPAEVPCAT